MIDADSAIVIITNNDLGRLQMKCFLPFCVEIGDLTLKIKVKLKDQFI